MRIMKRASLLAVAGVLALFTGACCWADFVQGPVDGGLALVDGSMMGAYLTDDFTLSTGTGVDGIAWWGGYLGQTSALPDSFSSDFTITIYSDSGGHPGLVVQSYLAIDVTRTATALLGDDMVPSPASPASEFIYEFTYQLPSTLALTPGTTYYLSIFDRTNANSTWLAGSGGDGISFYGGNPALNGGAWANQQRDYAFELSSPIPEPISMVMLGGLGAGILAARKLRASSKTVSRSL